MEPQSPKCEPADESRGSTVEEAFLHKVTETVSKKERDDPC